MNINDDMKLRKLERDHYDKMERDHERDMEHAQELVAAQIDAKMEEVWAEVDNGDHDDELSQSNWLQLDTLARVGRMAASNRKQLDELVDKWRTYDTQYQEFADDLEYELSLTAPTPTDLRDLNLQITDYVRDVAEMRLAR